MSATATTAQALCPPNGPITQTTLLELVHHISQNAEDETEVVEVVVELLKAGRAKLTGNFRDQPITVFSLR